MKYRFTFAKGKKETCPSCYQKRKYRRYIDLETGELLPYQYGKCERIESCQYHLNPYTDKYHLKGNDYSFNFNYNTILAIKKPKVYHLPDEVLESTKTDYNINQFLINLKSKIPFPFKDDDIEKLIDLYQLGTINFGSMKGAITFPYINENYNTRAIQCATYDKDNHRLKMNFIHALLEYKYKAEFKQLPSWLNDYNTNDKKIDCFFGAHIVSKFKNNPIAIVEAPKTALICTLYYGFPDNPFNTIWFSATMLNGLSEDKFKAIQNRKVTLYPDLSKDKIAFNEWKNKAEFIQEIYPNIQINVSDYLEKVATTEQRNKGYDLADFLINHNWQLFRNHN